MTVASQFSQRAQLAGPQPISELMRVALARPELISLAAGFVDQHSLPVDAVRESIDAVLNDAFRARAALQYGTNAGHVPLRQAVLERFLAADGPQSSPRPAIDQVLLTAGSNQLLHLVGEVLLDPGDCVLCAAPTYFVFLGILSSLGARAIGVAIDQDGMIPEALEQQLAERQQAGELARVKAIYVTSYYENPSTVSLSRQRRAQIVALAKRWSLHGPIYVIDDAAYRELRFAGPDLPSLRSFDAEGDTVIVAETFSKSFSPGIRVGWGILPPELVAPIAGLKANVDFGSPHFNQLLMAEVLSRGLLEPHIQKLRDNYSHKLEVMLAAMDRHLSDIPGVQWDRPSGGLYVWLRLPETLAAGPDSELIRLALDEGVLYVPGEYCYPSEGEPVRKSCIRLSFGVQPPEALQRGIEALGRAIRRAVNG